YRAREMMYGSREAFEYFECSECGCLQIAKMPENPGKYYPDDYYSLKLPGLAQRLKSEIQLWTSALSRKLRGAQQSPTQSLAFVPRELPRSTSILEIGCGRGYLIEALYLAGFDHVHGIDPYMPERGERRAPFRLERADPEALLARGR